MERCKIIKGHCARLRSGNLNSPDERFEYAATLEEQGKYAEALEQWRELSTDHKGTDALCRLGSLVEQLGYIEEAESAFREAIRVNDKESTAFVGLAGILIDKDEFGDAVRHLQKALTLEKNEYAYTMLGVAQNRAGNEQEAINSFEAALLLDPAFEEAYFNLGVIKCKTDPSEGERLFLRAIEIDPGYADAHRELGWLLNKRGDFAQAEYHLRRALELKPNDGWARIYLGNLMWRKHDIAAAIPEFERAIALMPNRSLPLFSLANVYEDQERWEEAEKLYERAINAQPDDAVAHMNFGRMLSKQGDLARADVELRLALSLDPNYSTARELLTRLKTNTD